MGVAGEQHHAGDAIIADIVEQRIPLMQKCRPGIAAGPFGFAPAAGRNDDFKNRGAVFQSRLQPGELSGPEHGFLGRIRGGIGITMVAHVEKEKINGAISVTEKHTGGIG